MKVLMTIPCLRTGGAEWAFIRQAKALADGGHEVICYVPYRQASNPKLLEALERWVSVVSLPFVTAFVHRLLYKMSLLFPSLDPEQRLHSFVIQRLQQQHHFAVVNPHLRAGATMVCRAFEHTAMPIVETDHGDYQLLLAEDPQCLRPENAVLMRRMNGVACPSESNEVVVKTLPWRSKVRFAVVPYAMEKGAAETVIKTSEPFTFGMVARGVKEKGWAEAVQAFRLLRSRVNGPLRLMLVGEGTEIDRLRQECAAEHDIVFTGYQADTSAVIAEFDVGMLPSFFRGESLPCAVIECLTQGKPVIATNVGGIPEMLKTGAGACGLLVPLDPHTQRADVEALASSMQSLLADSALRERCANVAREASQRYSPERCCAAYTALFTSMIPSSMPTSPVPL